MPFAQNNPGENETTTAGYNLLKAEIAYRKKLNPLPRDEEVAFGIVGTNLLNDDVRNSTSFKKGRDPAAGARVKFYLNGKFGGEPTSDRTPWSPRRLSSARRRWPQVGIGPASIWAATSATAPAAPIPTRNSPTLLPGSLQAVSKNYSPIDGWIGGGQIGFNWQAGAWVAGIEADFQGSRQRGSATTFDCAGENCNPAIAEFEIDAPVSAIIHQRLDWFGTLRARLGVTPTPESLLYVTGGLAVGRIKTSGTVDGSSLTLIEDIVTEIDPEGNEIQVPVVVANTNATSTSFVGHKTKAGWTSAPASRRRLWGNWTGKVEYLYVDFGRISSVVNLPQNSIPLAVALNSRVTDNIFRVGLNYRFNQH